MPKITINTKKNKKEDFNTNALMNAIAPMGVGFGSNTFHLSEMKGKAFGISKYPPQMPYGWLSKITNIPGTIASLTVEPIESGDFVEAASNNIRQKKGELHDQKDPLLQSRAEKAIEDGGKLLRNIDQSLESVVEVTAVVASMADKDDSERFEKTKRGTSSSIRTTGCKPRVLSSLQKEALMQLSPYYGDSEELSNMLKKPMPSSTFWGGLPFASEAFTDKKGHYLAKDVSGGISIIDMWKRGGDRTNSNMVVMGIPGIGKSTILKHIALSQYMLGTKIIFMDPDREYKELTRRLNGDWINAGGSAEGMNNILQIKSVPKLEKDELDEDELDLFEDEGQGIGSLALYLKSLEVFFRLYLPSITEIQMALLKDALIELYSKFGIVWDTDISEFKNEDYPRMSDLFELIQEKLMAYVEQDKINSLKEIEAKAYYGLATLLKDSAVGSDSFVFNGYTTISPKSRCICIDTKDLELMGDNIKKAQYYNILNWAWNEMSKDRTEKVLLFCDEAYLMIDRKVPQSLVFLRNTSKRSRKYESGIVIISHSVVDFLADEVKMYGQSLLDSPCYKFLMGSDGKNLEETVSLYKLTEAEEELLAKKKRGVSLALIGSKRVELKFEIPEYKFKYFGKAGGR